MADTTDGRTKKARDAERRQRERDVETALERARDADDAPELVKPGADEAAASDEP